MRSIVRPGDMEARHHADKLRDAVQKRAKEKGITLIRALLEIESEGRFSASNADRDARLLNLRRERDGSKGWARDCLARLVNDKTKELLSRDHELSDLAAFKKATEIVLRENQHLLSDYRKDVEAVR